MKHFYAGILGGVLAISIVVILFIVSLFFCNYHLYTVKIINPASIDSCEKRSEKMKLISEMEKDHILLTPQEYTNNVISYYNTVITFLVALFIIFSIFSVFHLKFITNEQLHKSLEDKLKESIPIRDILMGTISGKIDEKYASIEDTDVLSNRISALEDAIGRTDE